MAMGRSNFALAQFLLARQARTSRLHFTAALKLIVSSQTVVLVLEFYKVDILIFNFSWGTFKFYLLYNIPGKNLELIGCVCMSQLFYIQH